MWDIRLWPSDLSLRLRAHEVTTFDDPEAPEETQWLRTLVIGMGTTMYAHEGAGLAAPQVGVQERVIVLKDDDPKLASPGQKPIRNVGAYAMVNPRILEHSEETETAAEGCLSLPGIRVEVERPVAIIVEHESTFGETLQVEVVGVDARVVQHEIDHLDGKLLIDYLEQPHRRIAAVTVALMAERNRVEAAQQMQQMAVSMGKALGG